MGKVVKLANKANVSDEVDVVKEVNKYIKERYGKSKLSQYFIDEIGEAYLNGYDKGVEEGRSTNVEHDH